MKAETGWNMEIISGLEEGRLIHLGVMTGAEPGAGGRVLLLDLGGGSCEITLSEHKRIKETVSLPLGAVRLTEEFLRDDPAPADGLARMRQLIARELRRAHRQDSAGTVALVIATSGTAAALSDAFAAATRRQGQNGKAENSNEVRPDHNKRQRGSRSLRASRRAAAGMCRQARCADWPRSWPRCRSPQREAVPGIGPRRAEIIVAGAEVFAEAAGELRPCRLPLLAAGPARRHSGADARRAGRPRQGASRVRA